MHEAGLIMEALKTIQKSAVENNIQQVTKITLSVGRLTMALPKALSFAFRILSQGTMFGGAELEIEQKELCLECCTCGVNFSPADIDFTCPECGSALIKILEGHELHILSYEGEADKIEGNCCPEVAASK
ncbi:MAG TPA: hydrogenase maturation nickel metallochaperone HypA [Desulfotomaculum sp.]|nr:hydrogenase maturation nickel metallochaperone HypA [Desulfotomaculum sp.]